MSPDQRSVRKFIFDHFFEHSTPPVIEEVMQKFGLGRAQALSALKGLEEDHHILLVPGTQRILMANPYSAVTTPFLVHIGGRRYFANCAWDTISMHMMLEMDARVESYCHHCGEGIELSLSDGRVISSSPPSPIIFLSTSVSRWYENLINTCSNNMVYFASEEHSSAWRSANPSLAGESLSPEKMIEVCRLLSKGRAGLDYERPPKEDLMRHWESIGLKSEFWKF